MSDPRRLIFRSLGAIALALSALNAGVARAQFPDTVRALEANGRLAEARQQVEALKASVDATDLKAHLDLIAKTTTLLAAVDAYVKNGFTKQAIDVSTQFLPAVSTARDAGLEMAVRRRIVALQTDSSANARALQALTRADSYLNRGLYQKAKEGYDAVAKQSDSISTEARSRAKVGVENATQKLFDDEPRGVIATLIRSVRDAFTTVGQWVLSLFVALFVIYVLRRLWLTSKRSLELVDLSVTSASPTANRELAQALQDVIARIGRAGPGSAKLDASATADAANDDSPALPAPDLIFVTPPVDAPEFAKDLDAFVASAPAISVGGIGLNPQQLWTFVKRLLVRRPRHAFTGTLVEYEGSLTLRLMHEDRLLGRASEWRGTASPSASPEARITCLVDVASQLVLRGDSVDAVTNSCESLKEYILGLYALGSNTADGSKRALMHFQRALDRDGGNWLARFQRALCARGAKDTRTAMKHLDWFSGSQAVGNKSLQVHIKKYPDFPYVVQYQRASTLSLSDDVTANLEADELLDALVALETNDEGKKLEAKKRLRLVMLARSGQSSREAVKASSLRNDDAGRKLRGAARDSLHAQRDWFNENADDLQRAAPSGHPLARGIVLHAYGRLQFASGDRNAIESLGEAADLMPDYCEVRVDLAKAYLEQKWPVGWPQRVTTLLDQALALDASNVKAKFVYARFYCTNETRDYAKAAPYLAAAPFDPTSLFMLAQLLNNRGEYIESLELLERSIALQEKGPHYRIRLYAEALLELTTAFADKNITGDAKPKRRMIEHARRTLCGYAGLFATDDDRRKSNYKHAAGDYAAICRLLKIAPGPCFATPPSPPVAAPPGVLSTSTPASIEATTSAD